jgi:hypothetical protein
VILQTGGSAVGEISTRSRPFSRAIRTASYGCMTPSWPPSSSITRTSRARIRSFTRVRSLCCRKLRSAIFPPNKFKAPDTRLAGYCPDSLHALLLRETCAPRQHGAKTVKDGLQSIARRQLATARVRCPTAGRVARKISTLTGLRLRLPSVWTQPPTAMFQPMFHGWLSIRRTRSTS